MTYNADLDTYELHVGVKKFQQLYWWMLGFWHYEYGRGWLLFKSIFVYYILLWLYMNVIFLRIHIVTCNFIIEIVWVLLGFTKQKLVYRVFSEYVANARDAWFSWKVHPSRPKQQELREIVNPKLCKSYNLNAKQSEGGNHKVEWNRKQNTNVNFTRCWEMTGLSIPCPHCTMSLSEFVGIASNSVRCFRNEKNHCEYRSSNINTCR